VTGIFSLKMGLSFLLSTSSILFLYIPQQFPLFDPISSVGIMLPVAFLAVAGIALNVFHTSAHKIPRYNSSQTVETQTLESPYPYIFPLLQNGSQADSGQFPMPMCHGFKLEEATIDELQEELSSGRLTSVKLVLCYLRRIYQTDSYIR
jgi:amidase